MNARAALALLACCLGFAAAECRSEVIVGLHLGSVHVPAKDYHENVNPGGYVQIDRFVGGAYRNSIGGTTVYAAYAHPLGHGFELLVGGGTGYKRECETVTTTTASKQQRGTATYTAKTTTTTETCRGFSRTAIAPVAGLTYTAPFKAFGATPRAWLIPGSKHSSTVLHASLQWEL